MPVRESQLSKTNEDVRELQRLVRELAARVAALEAEVAALKRR